MPKSTPSPYAPDGSHADHSRQAALKVEQAIKDFKAGRMVIIVDDEDRENEGDFAMAAEKASPDAVNFMAVHGRGLICTPMAGKDLDRLKVPQMVDHNTATHGTAFTVSVDAARGITTGISAADRARTIRLLADPESGARTRRPDRGFS
jgi:3,4-dihydroxy 2-butanone 4-phosphate synthase / GTP cyclohydrolase II